MIIMSRAISWWDGWVDELIVVVAWGGAAETETDRRQDVGSLQAFNASLVVRWSQKGHLIWAYAVGILDGMDLGVERWLM